MNINTWPIQERPREKLLQQGAHNLSDTGLLAIFLRTGVRGKNAVDLARKLLNKFGNLKKLFESNTDDFCKINGLGTTKYATLHAALEISKRYFIFTITIKLIQLSTSPILGAHINYDRNHESRKFN